MESTNLDHVVLEKLNKNFVAEGGSANTTRDQTTGALLVSDQEIMLQRAARQVPMNKSGGYRVSKHTFDTSRVLGFVLDLSFLLWSTALLTEGFNLFPRATPLRVALLCAISVVFAFLPYPWLKTTLGQWLMRPKDFDKKNATLITRTLSFAFFYGIGGLLFLSSVPFHPGLQSFKLESLPVFLPVPGQAQYQILSFYYSMGALPDQLITGTKSLPLYLELPYFKGPPQVFIGALKIKMGPAELTLEGPKTPKRTDVTTLQNCLALSPGPSSCIDLREAVLGRHLREMRTRLGIATFRGSFFEVANPALRPQDQPRGFKLVSQNRTQGETRYVLINQEGTQQTFILRYPLVSAVGESSATLDTAGEVAAARDFLDQWIQSSRLAPEIHSPRAWMSNLLSDQSLLSLQNVRDFAAFETKISAIQAQLIAHLSVSPASVAPYYHLAGTYLLLAKRAHGLAAYTETLERAKRGILASVRYARDVANVELESDRRQLRQIEAIWTSSKAL